MWKVFSTELKKVAATAYWEPDEVDDPTQDDLDPDAVTGTLTVTFPTGGDYSWPNITYQEYLDFEDTGFSLSWVNANLEIDYFSGADWGWPFGRVK